MPRHNSQHGIATIPLGGLDGDPGIRPAAHIFTASKAGWHEITDNLAQFEELPPPA